MNGKYIHYKKEESVKTTGREINPIPGEKVDEIIDEFMKDGSEDSISSDNIEDIPVEDLDFSIRTFNCLHLRANLKTLGDILNTPLCDLVKIRNFGRKCLKEVQEVLKKYGYQYIIGDPDHYEDKPALICKATVDDIKANIKSLSDDILELWGKGYNVLGIAEKLNIAESTVREKLTTAGVSFAITNVWDSLTKNEKDSVTRQIITADNLKAPSAIAKKMCDLETENADLRSKYEQINSMYLKCASAFENLKKENEKLKKDNCELEGSNKILSNGKLKDMEAYKRLQDKYDVLRDKFNNRQQTRPAPQSCRHDVSTMIREVIDAMCRDKIEEIGVIIDGFVVQIHPRKDEKKLGTYTIRARESIV